MTHDPGSSSEVGRQRHLLDVINNFKTAMLVTRTADGALRSRPLAVAECGSDGTIYFATSSESGKVNELEDDARVNVTMQNDNQYVSLTGLGEIVDDRALVERLWSEAWKVWFPEGKDDPSLRILVVHPDMAEYWDNSGTDGLRYVLEAARAYASGRKARVLPGQNAKLHPRPLPEEKRPDVSRWSGLAAGLSGALVLTAVHEAVRRVRPDAPGVDRVAERGLDKVLGALPGRSRYFAALGGDVLASSLFYGAALARQPERPLLRGLLAGTLAGAGAAMLPERLGLAPARRARPVSKAMTVAWYALGGLAAGIAYRRLCRARYANGAA
jgi:general stress protein 26